MVRSTRGEYAVLRFRDCGTSANSNCGRLPRSSGTPLINAGGKNYTLIDIKHPGTDGSGVKIYAFSFLSFKYQGR